MANEKIMNTRIQLKYDSYEKWQNSTVVLKAGEVAIANLGPTNKDNSTHASGQHPVLIKVGDNTHTFAQLPWLSALAADVYAWAKKESPDWNDFPALPIEVIDNGDGKFVTDIEYADNKITISRANVVAADIADAPWVTKDTVTTVAAGSGIEVTSDNAEDPTYTVSHANTSDVANVTAADRTYVKALTFDEFGHVTDVQTGTETVTDTNTITTISAGNLMGEIKDEGENGNHAYVINGKDWSSEIATALADAKKYADDNDANDNTAHTHTAGDGLKLSGDGGIDGVVDYSLNLALKLEDGNIILHDKDDAIKVIATLDAAELLEDSYLNDVNIIDNELQFTWKMDDGSTKTDSVDLKHLVDVYTGENEGTVKVEVDNYKISAEVIDGTLVDKHIAANAAIAETKLAQGVQDALALARTALQSVEHPDYTDEFAGKKDKQTAVENKITNAAHVLTSLTQNANGDIAYEVKELTPADINTYTKEEINNQNAVILSEAQKYADNLNHEDTKYSAAVNGGLKLNENNEFSIDDSITFVFYCGTSSEII